VLGITSLDVNRYDSGLFSCVLDFYMNDPSISRPGNGARTFLFFNDDQEILDGISPLLEAKGHRVFAVASGAAAFQVMEQHYREIDSLIIDCSISSSSGLQLLNRFRSNGWKHPTVLCSDTLPEIKDHPRFPLRLAACRCEFGCVSRSREGRMGGLSAH